MCFRPGADLCYAMRMKAAKAMQRSIIIMMVLVCPWVHAKFIAVETEQVPIARLIGNLEKQLQQKPNDFELHYALARVDSMAYALKSGQIAVKKNSESPWFGHLDRGEPPRQITPA